MGYSCSGGAYWEGGSEGAGSIFTLGRFPEAGLRQYSLAGGKLAYVNTIKQRRGNFTSRAGRQVWFPHLLSSLLPSGSMCITCGEQHVHRRHSSAHVAAQLPSLYRLA